MYERIYCFEQTNALPGDTYLVGMNYLDEEKNSYEKAHHWQWLTEMKGVALRFYISETDFYYLVIGNPSDRPANA